MYLLPIIISFVVSFKKLFFNKRHKESTLVKLLITLLMIALSCVIQYFILFSEWYKKMSSEQNSYLIFLFIFTVFIIPYLIYYFFQSLLKLRRP